MAKGMLAGGKLHEHRKDKNGMIKTIIKQMEFLDGKPHLKWLHMLQE